MAVSGACCARRQRRRKRASKLRKGAAEVEVWVSGVLRLQNWYRFTVARELLVRAPPESLWLVFLAGLSCLRALTVAGS